MRLPDAILLLAIAALTVSLAVLGGDRGPADRPPPPPEESR